MYSLLLGHERKPKESFIIVKKSRYLIQKLALLAMEIIINPLLERMLLATPARGLG